MGTLILIGWVLIALAAGTLAGGAVMLLFRPGQGARR